MSDISQATQAPAGSRSTASAASGERTRYRVALFATSVIAIWSVVELIDLGIKHTTGEEIYGPIAAVLAIAAGVASLLLLRSSRPHTVLTFAVLALWAVIALAGIAGTVVHVVGPTPGHGPVDLRPRPILAPLIFTTFGLVGAAALVAGKRPSLRRLLGPGKE
jgi:peptidoglycan/LPS O-acetylase OafA/YrhL